MKKTFVLILLIIIILFITITQFTKKENEKVSPPSPLPPKKIIKQNSKNSVTVDSLLSEIDIEDAQFHEKIQEIAKTHKMIIAGDPNNARSKKIIDDIIYVGDRSDIEELLYDMKSPDPEVRADAVDELGFLDDVTLEPVIIKALHSDPSSEVRQMAAASLETHDQSPAATRALVHALRDKNENVRDSVLTSLAAIGSQTVQKELTKILQEGDLDKATAQEVRIFLDDYYLKTDPFKDFSDE